MSNFVKYGRYWIAAGIAVTGVLWFNRPLDPRIKGEDIADVFEAVQDLNVAYLTGDQVPDWSAWNLDSTNSIYAPIQYEPIQRMETRPNVSEDSIRLGRTARIMLRASIKSMTCDTAFKSSAFSLL